MSSRRSDNFPGTADAPATAPDAPGGPAPAWPSGPGSAVAPAGFASAGSAAPPPRLTSLTGSPTGWKLSLLVNLPIPLLLLVLVGFGYTIDRWRWIDPYFLRIITLVGFNIVLAVGLQLINGFSGQFSLGHAGFMAVGAYLAAYPARVHAQLDAAVRGPARIDHPFGVLSFYVSLGLVLVAGAALVYGLLALVRATRKLHPQAPALLMLAGLGWVVWDFAQASRFESPPAYLVWSRAAGFLSAAFDWLSTALGPVANSLSAALPAFARQPATFVVLVLGGGAFAAAAGFVVGIPTLRLRGDYLAIATLGLAEIIRIAIQNSRPLGGALGLTAIPKYTDFAWLYGLAVLAAVLVWRLAYSARGRLIQAVREDEIAASAVGVDPTGQKVLAFVAGAFLGGVAGALFAMNERSITPSYFGLQKSIEVVVMVTLGGLGSISGAILAAVVLTVLPELLRPIAEFRMILYALLLVGMMLLRPQGLLGGVELWPRRKHGRAAGDDRQRGFGVVTRAGGPPTAGVAADGLPGAEPDPDEPHHAFAADPSDERLEARCVCRRFGGLTALNDFSICVARGELVGLIGPNGAGKTTAFNVVTGVYAPTDGEVALGGRRIDGLSSVRINRHGVARTFQNIRLFKSLTVLDNVAAALKNPAELSLWRTLLRTPRFFRERAASEAQAMSLLRTMGLAHVAGHAAGSLPYGDQRRLEIARALATRPAILLLDEPAAGMNPQEKVELTQLIRFIRDRFGVGILLIEHDMKLVMNVCQKITVLDHGETIAVGTPEQVRQDPRVIEAYLGEPE